MDPSFEQMDYPERRDFTSTHWSVVLAAKDGDDTRARGALEALCRSYWYPLYAFVRRKGYSPHDAEDLTQAFFERLVEKHCLREVHPSKGRFRAFLLASVKNFLANELDKAQAIKRGGKCKFESLDLLTAEERYAREPQDGWAPDALYDRRWALTLLEQSLNSLREEYRQAGRTELFDALKGSLTPHHGESSHAELAKRLGKSEAAVAMDVHRLRRRYRECLREQIRHTVTTSEAVDLELGELARLLAPG
jgi:RNA polymerase sigma-70 factor (ECF subfamily)